MKLLAACLTIALIIHASTASAQSNRDYPSGAGVPRSHYGFGHAVGGHIRHDSTYEAGILRGTAAMIQARGQYNLLTSLAMLNVAKVRQIQWEMQQQQAAVKAVMKEAYKHRRAAQLAERRAKANRHLARIGYK
jgi:hypothetical protein